MRLSLLTILFYFVNAGASVEPVPTCAAKAQVVEIKSQSQASAAIKLKITAAEGVCGKMKVGKHIDAQIGVTTLKKGDTLTAKTGESSSMGPNGAVSFIEWTDLKVTNRKVDLPASTFMQSGTNFY